MIALPAIKQGIHLAKNFNRFKQLIPFNYHNQITMAIIGRNYFFFFAWLIWMSIHLIKIVGINKL
ncbi:MAG: hypothetical protein ACFYI8_00055 [Candidatus Karelsulcia muelleri]